MAIRLFNFLKDDFCLFQPDDAVDNPVAYLLNFFKFDPHRLTDAADKQGFLIGKLVVRYHSFFEEGIVNTLIIAAFTVFFGTIFGTLMSSMRMSKILPLKWLAVAYIEFIRGTPLMVQLMFIFYGLPMVGFTLPDISWIPNFSRFSAGIIAMSINSCAYVAEIIRAGIQAVDKGQMEGARSCGMTNAQAMRYVVMPQAVKNILPAIGNEMIALLKETSVAGYVSVRDLTKMGSIIQTQTYDAFNPILLVAAIYLVLVLGLTKLLSVFERRFKKSDRS